MASYKPPFDPPPGWMEIGTIVSPQGLKGELRVYPNSDFPERFEVPGERWIYGPDLAEPKSVQLERGNFLPGKGLYVVKLAGVGDRDGAEALRDKMLVVPSTDIPQLPEGEYHVSALIGLKVILQSDRSAVGTVVDLMSAGNTILVVHGAKGEHLIPFVTAIVPVVDIAAGCMEITPPTGLLSLNAKDYASEADSINIDRSSPATPP